MRIWLTVSSALLLSTLLVAQEHPGHTQSKPATLMTGMGDLHHPVSTKNPQAQQFFNQGLRLIYAFNHEEAERSFQRAADLDPRLAIAYWGVAEAEGPNYNDPASDERFLAAHQAARKQSIFQPTLRRRSKLISRRWRCAFLPTRRRTGSRRLRLITMPCGRW